MKKMTRKLLMSVLSLAFAIVALGTTTFAWFTAQATATVSNINVNIAAADSGVLISQNTIDFGSNLTYRNKATLDQLSPLHAINKDNSVVYNDIDGQAIAYDETTKKVPGTFNVPLYLMSQSGQLEEVYFKVEASSTGIGDYIILQAFKYGATDPKTEISGVIQVAGSNALRLRTSMYVTTQERVTGTDISGTADFGTVTHSTKVYRFEDDAPAGTDSAKFKNFGYDMSLTNAANSYYQQITGRPVTEDEIESDNAVVFTSGNYAQTLPGLSETINIEAGKMRKFDFTFYLEGFDADCFDAIGGQGLNITITFSKTNLFN